MKGYEFTDRGRFIIVVLIIALLIIPATVVAFRVWSSMPPQPPDDPDNQISQHTPDGTQPEDPEPIVTASPPPSGGDPDPVDPPDEGTGEQGSFDPPVEPPDGTDTPDDPDDPTDPADPGDTTDPTDPDDQGDPPVEPPEIGPVGINRHAGTMQFMFAPEHQDSLDSDTISMIGEFITSPRNTGDSIILVKIPKLTAEKSSVLTSAINSAFSQHGIDRRKLSFEIYQPVSSDSPFEIMMSFTPTSSPK